VRKTFGDQVGLQDVSIAAPTGKLVALLGPSGSGKTTLLRIIAGLDFPDSGTVHLHGEDATGRKARDRGVGFVFQHYALFRHMTVFENVAFGLRVRPRRERPSSGQIRATVEELLDLVQLRWLGDRYPSQLSGGQRQRIALARALAVKPRVLLLDEPFGALDAMVRKDLRRWLRELQDQLQVTTVLVTHDREEALEVADAIVVMNNGRVEQEGSPEYVYANPATPFVYRFLGGVNLFHGRLRNGEVDIGGSTIQAPELAEAEDQKALAIVRSYDFDVTRVANRGLEMRATVRHVRAVGHVVRVELSELSGKVIEVELPAARFGELALGKGDSVFVVPRLARVFPQGA
ncbi:MAG TPA: sulfate/molybdate ABC transporter ATP-binding protein, partial [Gemmatimonadaceae bacterium]|nr:sulfate/molybdate ABC transporter ATP-binding protein [Gemmatimonadaceae bacterium]